MIANMKDLETFLKLCRKQGVTEIKFEGVSVNFGDLPAKHRRVEDDDEKIQTDEPTFEQLAFYSAGTPEP